MKKYFQLFVLAIVFTFAAISSSGAATLKNAYFEVLSCDSVINVKDPKADDDPFVSNPDIKNVSTVAIPTKMKVFVDKIITNHSITVCYKDCYAPFTTTWICPDVVTINPNQKLSSAIGSSKVIIDFAHDMGMGTSNYRIRFYNAGDETQYIEYPVTYNVGVSGVETENTKELAIYPNPAQSAVNVTLSGLQAVKVQLFDMFGNKVIENSVSGLDKFVIDGTNLASGNYIVVVSDVYGKTIKRNVSFVK